MIPNAETRILFNDSIKILNCLSILGFLIKQNIDIELEYQVDIASVQNVSSPDYLLVTHQGPARTAVPNKGNIIAVFDKSNVRK